MDVQEAKRGAQHAAVKARQNAQAEVAQSLPESNRWLDPELIDRYARCASLLLSNIHTPHNTHEVHFSMCVLWLVIVQAKTPDP